MVLHARRILTLALLWGSLFLASDGDLLPGQVLPKLASGLQPTGPISAGAKSPRAPTPVIQDPGPANFENDIVAASKEHGVEEQLIRAIIQTESEFDQRAVSARGACGLMQLMPRTALSLGVKDCFDARQNIQAGTRYLKGLLLKYEGSVSISIAAYHAGEGAVARHGGIPPYRQTRDYVRRVTALL